MRKDSHANRGSKPAPVGGLAKLELGPTKPAKPVPVADDPPRKFIPPQGVTRRIGSGSAPPDIPLPQANADWGAPARSGRAPAKVGALFHFMFHVPTFDAAIAAGS